MSSSTPNGSIGSFGGNTITPKVDTKKRVSPSQFWCFTLNNWTEEELVQMVQTFDLHKMKYIIGKEIGETGTPHLQGYLENGIKIRPFNLLKGWKRIHWEKRKGSRAQNVAYCSKDGKFIIKGLKVKRSVKILDECDLYSWERDIIEIIETEPNDRTIYWYVNKECGAGKTTFCKYLIQKHGAIVLGGKSADMKNGIISYTQSTGETPELILVNLPKTFDTQYLSYTGIEECKDMMFYSGKYEGGQICGNCPHLFIFANEMPSRTAMDVSRWKVFDMDTNEWVDLTLDMIESEDEL